MSKVPDLNLLTVAVISEEEGAMGGKQYVLSYAGGNSGYSFGLAQNDAGPQRIDGVVKYDANGNARPNNSSAQATFEKIINDQADLGYSGILY
jgi:hypothetical protein